MPFRINYGNHQRRTNLWLCCIKIGGIGLGTIIIGNQIIHNASNSYINPDDISESVFQGDKKRLKKYMMSCKLK